MHDLEPGQVISGRYEVAGVLGRGGMATVYLVTHLELGSRHALKLLDIPAASIRLRLLQEGRIQASLAHPNIVSVTDVLDIEGSPGLVMEYVDGPTLTDLLAVFKPTLHDAEGWFRTIASAVAYAHQRGLVHRDLKPDNILMVQVDGAWLPKVADFGIAKAMGERDRAGGTKPGSAMGTPAYMPPEQVNDAASADQRADIFALGCILYELICGRGAFARATVLETYTAVLRGDYTRPELVVPGLPPRFAQAIAQALEPDRTLRVANVPALLKLLDDHDAVPVVSRRPTPVSQARWWVQWGMLAGVVPLVGALIGGIVAAGLVGAVLLGGPSLVAASMGSDDEVERPDEAPEDDEPSPLSGSLGGVPTVENVTIRAGAVRQIPNTQKGVFRFAATQGTLTLIDVTLENHASDSQDFGVPWTLVSPGGVSHSAPLKCWMSLKDALHPMDSVEAGATIRGWLCFDTPHDIRGYRIRFSPTGGHRGETWIEL